MSALTLWVPSPEMAVLVLPWHPERLCDRVLSLKPVSSGVCEPRGHGLGVRVS